MIDIRDVWKSFDGKAVLKGIDLSIPRAKTTVIVGCSGCGKTVLLRSILGLVRPDRGSILVENSDITTLDRNGLFQMRKKFGMLFQGSALFDSMTVEENVGLALREHTRMDAEKITKRVIAVLGAVGLSGIGDKKPAELSGGMKKRVGLARALAMDPKCVLFDEPTTGLDPVMANTINRLIRDTSRQFGLTSVVVTHDLSSAFFIADRLAMIHDGKIVFSGTSEEFRKCRKPEVRCFLEGRDDV